VNDRLEHEFGRESLFLDVDAIPLGFDFVEVLGAEVAKWDVLLAIIGPNWLDARDEEGSRRLDSEHDFVRIEIAAALKRKNTRYSNPARWHERAQGRAAAASFRSDMDRLVRALRGTGATPPAQPAARSREDPMRAEGRIKLDASIVHGAPEGWFKPGAGKSEWFKDHERGPDMVVVPAGEFTMGSSESEIAALKKDYWLDWYDYDSEGPQRTVQHQGAFCGWPVRN
jgi:hypothetical protein